MRIGTSPNKGVTTDYRPARVTVCVLVHVPHLQEYYARRLDVVRLCLASLFATTKSEACDVLVFDNASCAEARAVLRAHADAGDIHYLIESQQNVGKANAYRQMFALAPGDVVAYSDDDVLFHPGWLEAHLAVLDAFPRVGMVSGQPVNLQFRYGNTTLDSYLDAHPSIAVERGKFIPDDWEREFALSTGRDGAARSTYEEVRLTLGDRSAYATATHFQFVAPRAVMLEATAGAFEPRLLREPVRAVDERLDARGYVRLSTVGRHVQHIGNVITADLQPALDAYGLAGRVDVWTPPRPWARAVATRLGWLARLTNWVYLTTRYREPR